MMDQIFHCEPKQTLSSLASSCQELSHTNKKAIQKVQGANSQGREVCYVEDVAAWG